MLKTFEVIVDVEVKNDNKLFEISQNDLNSVQINFIIKQDSQAFNLTDCTIKMAIKKPSGMLIYQDVNVDNAITGVASVVLATQGSTEIGSHLAELVIYKTEQTIQKAMVTSSFTYIVRSAILNDNVLASNNDFQAIYNTGGAGLKLWSGTQSAYDGIATKDTNTLYFISGV